MARAKHIPLNLAAFEERINPASATFLNGTLTIVPTAGDTITVDIKTAAPFAGTPGFLDIGDGTTTFFSSSATQKVDNIKVSGSAVANYTFNLSAGVKLTNLSITGGTTSTNVNLTSNILSGGFAFKGTEAGSDTISLTSFTNSGSVAIDLGNGTNSLNFNDGKVGGDFSVNGGNGNDTMGLAKGDITVNGGMGLALGDGRNLVIGLSTSAVKVSKNLTYVGGSGRDFFSLGLTSTTLIVGGNLSTSLKSAPVGDGNNVTLDTTFVGGSVNIFGGNVIDAFTCNSATICGNLVFTGAGGKNTFEADGLNVGGSVSITGEGGNDAVSINDSTIHQNLTVTLGNDDLGDAPFVTQGLSMGLTAPNSIGGNLMITGGAQADSVAIAQTKIGKNLSVNSFGGNDNLDLTSIVTDGSATINLGADNNTLNFNDGQVGGNFSYTGGNQVDTINLAQGDITVGGGMTLTLGDGENNVKGLSLSAAMKVGKSFSYVGGTGTDILNFDTNKIILTVGGDFSANLKSASNGNGNLIRLTTTFVGGNMNILGGKAIDQLLITNATIGGNLDFTGADGANLFSALGMNVGGSVAFTGGAGSDLFQVETSTIHQNLTVTLGNDDLGGVPINNLQVVKMGLAGPNSIGGNLMITGGAQADPVTILQTKIGKNLSVNSFGGNDNLDLTSIVTDGSATINLGADNNTLNFNSGQVGGNFSYTGGNQADTINLAQGDITLGGGMTLAPGDGANELTGLSSTATIKVGKSLSYTGGIGRDILNLTDNNTSLTVGGNFSANLKSAPNGDGNIVLLETAFVGGSVTILGDKAIDQFVIKTSATIGGNVTFTGAGNANRFKAVGLNVGGSVALSGGGGSDSIEIDGSTIHQNLTAMLGNDDGSGVPLNLPQRFLLGTISANVISGSVSVTGGAQADPVTIQQTSIGKNLSVSTLDGIDTVILDDLDVIGLTSINLGVGSDFLNVDKDNAFPRATQFSGHFTVNGGEGDDTFDFSSTGGNLVRFGGIVKILGDAGNDTLKNFAANTFILPGSRFEDCEVGTF